MVSCFIINIIFMSPATPAADSVCPMLLLTEPIYRGPELEGLALAMILRYFLLQPDLLLVFQSHELLHTGHLLDNSQRSRSCAVEPPAGSWRVW